MSDKPVYFYITEELQLLQGDPLLQNHMYFRLHKI